jgi:uncharacterized membrane protein
MTGETSSQLVQSIAAAETGSTAEVRVHLSRTWLERDTFGRAARLFERFGMFRTAERNAVLIYVNLRKRKLALVGDEGWTGRVNDRFWNTLAEELGKDLAAHPPEKAVSFTVLALGEALRQLFPAK